MPKLEPLNLRITGDSRGLSQALGRSQDQTRRFANGLDTQASKLRGGLNSLAAGFGPIGIAAGAAFAAVAAAAGTAYAAISKIRDVQADIDEVGKSADKLGLTFNELGALRLVIGESTGLDTSAIDSAIEKMLVNLAEAEKGSGRAFETLQRLGLEAGQLIELGPVEALKRISEETQKIQGTTDQLKIAYDLFGRSGTAVVSTLRGGAEAIDEAARFQEKWNGLSEAQLASVEASNDAWARVGLIVDGVIQEVSAELAPAMVTLAEEVLAVAEEFGGLDEVVRQTVDRIVIASSEMTLLLDRLELAARISLSLKTQQNLVTPESVSRALDFSRADGILEDIAARRLGAMLKLRDKGPSDRIIEELDAENAKLDETASKLDTVADKFKQITGISSTEAIVRGSAADLSARVGLQSEQRLVPDIRASLQRLQSAIERQMKQPKIDPGEVDRQTQMVDSLARIEANTSRGEPRPLSI